MRIYGGEHQRFGAVGAVFWAAQRNWRDVLHLPGRPVEFGHFGSAASIDHVRIERIGCNVAVLDDAHGMPVAIGDGAVVAAAGSADRSAFLLSRANFIGKRVRRNRVIELRRGLVVPGTPSLARVHGDDGALITDNQNNVAVVGIDPKILVVVAAGCAAKSHPRFAAVARAHGDRADHVDKVGILRINLGNGKISAADAARWTRIISDLRPTVSGVVGPIDIQFSRSGRESCVEPARIAWRDSHINLRGVFWQAVGQWMPGAAAVGGLEQSAPRAIYFVVIFPWALARFPHRSVNHVGIGGIDLNIGAAGVFVLRNDLLPVLPTVGGAIDSSLLAWSVGMAEHRSEDFIRVARIDGEGGYLLSVDQAEMLPGLARICRFVDPIADGEIGTMQSLTAAYINDVGI